MNVEAPLFRQISDSADSLSKNQRALARYILANYQSVAFCTITQLAELCSVSEATIVRFAKGLGFKGYPALQKEIRRMVRADLKGTDRFQLTDTARVPAAGPLDPVIDKELENISSLRETFDARALRKAVATINAASDIVVVGARSAAPLAHHLWFGLAKIAFPATRACAIDTETYDRINALARGALVICIGFPRYLEAQVRLLAFARQRRLKTLVITDSPFSPLQGDVNLYATAESASFVAFHAAPLILVNALLHELSLVDRRKTVEALSRFDALAEAEGYFHQG